MFLYQESASTHNNAYSLGKTVLSKIATMEKPEKYSFLSDCLVAQFLI